MRYAFALLGFGFLAIAVNGSALAQNSTPTDKKIVSKKVDTPKAGATSLDPQIAIQMATDYFNASHVMTADFIQIGADGRRNEGKLYVSKPGHLRFEYAQPATMEIIADGISVAVRDRKLHTQEIYFIGETPLKFLLNLDVNLKRDTRITDVTSDEKATTISLEDTATFGGTSKIRLRFENKNFSLSQWEVTDPQGYQTMVSLHNIDLKSTPDRNLFQIPKDTDSPFQN
jgi:outer membrane lipoprotein-sorting protein